MIVSIGVLNNIPPLFVISISALYTSITIFSRKQKDKKIFTFALSWMF